MGLFFFAFRHQYRLPPIPRQTPSIATTHPKKQDAERLRARAPDRRAPPAEVRGLARRYSDRGEPLDDLVQVGTIGLINAIDRFDPSRGIDFHLRRAHDPRRDPPPLPRPHLDRRVPRSSRTPAREITAGRGRPVGSHGRSPCVREIAEADADRRRGAGRPAAAAALTGRGLSAAGADGPGEREIAAATRSRLRRGGRPPRPGHGLAGLPPRERVILHLRFNEGLSQSQIAARIGISQMHVSRLIPRAIETLREDTLGGRRGRSRHDIAGFTLVRAGNAPTWAGRVQPRRDPIDASPSGGLRVSEDRADVEIAVPAEPESVVLRRARPCAGSWRRWGGVMSAAQMSRSPSPRPAPTRCSTPIPTATASTRCAFGPRPRCWW